MGLPDYDSRLERWQELVDSRLQRLGAYHDHKERMGHAGLLVMLALAGVVLTSADPVPAWVENVCGPMSVHAVAFVAIVVWSALHYYIRWQLRNRRNAALQIAGLMRVQRFWAIRPPSSLRVASRSELESFQANRNAHPALMKIVDLIWPVHVAPQVRAGDLLTLFPADVVRILLAEIGGKTGAIASERVMATLSIVLLFSSVARIYTYPG